jgi:hypothetical protein
VNDIQIDPGFIYVAINPSMPGLVKIGKTSRDPMTRVAELSAHTGVATPFILVFHAQFRNCSYIEREIHDRLEKGNHRLNDNREFFRIDVAEASRLVAEFEKLYGTPHKCDDSEVGSDSSETQEINDSSDLLAIAAYDYSQGNFGRAFSLFEKAGAAGASKAYFELGHMALSGRGCLKDKDQALQFWSLGAEKGDSRCLMMMAETCSGEEDHSQWLLAKKYLEDYLASGHYIEDRKFGVEHIFQFLINRQYSSGCQANWLSSSVQEVISDHEEEIGEIKRELLAYAIEFINRTRHRGFEEMYLFVAKAIQKVGSEKPAAQLVRL